MALKNREIADFSSLRIAFETLAAIWRTNGNVTAVSDGVRLSDIKRERWKQWFSVSRQHGAMMKQYLNALREPNSRTCLLNFHKTL